MALLSGTWYSKNGSNLAGGAVLKRSNIDTNDRIRIDSLGLVYYDIDDNWRLEAQDILLGSLVYVSALATKSGIFSQDPDNTSSFFFGANTADQGKGLLVIFNENFLRGLSLDPPKPLVPESIKPPASVIKSTLQATLTSQDDIGRYITANLAPTDTVSSSTASVELASNSQQNVILTGSENIGAVGNASDNTLVGNDGDNALDGGAGNDVLIGGLGNDKYYVQSVSDVVIELKGEGADIVYANIDYVLPDNVESLVLVGSATNGSGNPLSNTITGNDLQNFLYGFGGDDVLDGQGGADFLVGGFGNDTYVIDSLGDTIVERLNAGNDTVHIRIGGAGVYNLPNYVESAELDDGISLFVNGNNLSNSIVGNALNNSLWGLLGDDSLLGLEGSDRLIGGLGNDFLDGGAGDDILEGGLGNDYFKVDSSLDTVIELPGQGQDHVDASCDYSLPASVESIALTGSANLEGYGNSSNNLLKGNAGNNVLDGGLGADTLTGGKGSDRFVFSALSSFSVAKADRITDFESGLDTLMIGAKSFGLASTTGFSFSSVNGSSQLAASLRTPISIVYDQSTGYLYWNQNGSLAGAGAGGIFAILENKTPLGTADISFF